MGQREANNELTIRTATEEQTDEILEWLEEAQDEHKLDFAFEVIRNTYPR